MLIYRMTLSLGCYNYYGMPGQAGAVVNQMICGFQLNDSA